MPVSPTDCIAVFRNRAAIANRSLVAFPLLRLVYRGRYTCGADGSIRIWEIESDDPADVQCMFAPKPRSCAALLTVDDS